MPFLGPVVAHIETDTATLIEPLIYRGAIDSFTIPAGACTDFASVPRALTWLVPKMGAWTKASVLHDQLCNLLERGDDRVSAVDVDGVFRRVMREAGTPLVRRWLVWTAVRWGALGTPARRPGWWSTAGPVLAISVAALPFLLLPALFVGLALLVDRAVEAVR